MLAHPHRFSSALEGDIIRSDLAGSSRKHGEPGLGSEAKLSKPSSMSRKADKHSPKYFVAKAEPLFSLLASDIEPESHKAYPSNVSIRYFDNSTVPFAACGRCR